ncbi:MAG: Sialic acid transporter (permease) NanT [Myxococcaceae bacterium]|nr:Sialic acid transporter (permease) NanT [Myxococcaceae bacterium]
MPTPLTSYQRRLFLLLGVATFFEGYEYVALTQLLPTLRATYRLSQEQAGYLVGAIGFSAVAAFFLIRQADVVGRRRVLSITIAGYTLCSVLCALSQDVWQFGAAQLAARAFLLAEYAVCMVYLAEEFPADRRGFAVGFMQGLSTLGAIVCAGLVPTLLKTSWGFRTVYLVGSLPLLLLIWLRRGVRETKRFEEMAQKTAQTSSLFSVFRGPYRGRVFLLATIWGLTYLCTYLSITYWKEFAIAERAFDDAKVSHVVMIAAVGSLPLVFATGKLLDAIGRRRGAVLVFLCITVSTLLAYNAHDFWLLTLGVTGTFFSASAMLPVLNSFTLELFPTELRADGFGWSVNVLGKVSYVLGPLVVGFVANRHGYGMAMSAISIGPLLALGLILARLPETSGRELEDTSAL